MKRSCLVGTGRTVPFQVRMPVKKIWEMKRIAASLGVSACDLVRIAVYAQLDHYRRAELRAAKEARR
jgi:hypothetical protein